MKKTSRISQLAIITHRVFGAIRMRRLAVFVCLSIISQTAWATQNLQFRANGEFKILQFTDLHYIYDDPKSDVALQCIDELIQSEKPDLIICTGDNIWGKPGLPGMRRVTDHICQFGIPFAILFGNHDCADGGASHEAYYDQIRQVPYNVMPDRGQRRSPDYVLPIASHDGSRDAAYIYCLDSNSYPAEKGMGTYDWVHFEQVAWFRQVSDSLKRGNGGKALPALLFQHIPLPEYALAAIAPDNIRNGTRMERECPPEYNSGLFLAMKEAGNVMGMFVGHDHDNDYTTVWHDILLGYGRYSGGNNVYNHLKPNGARVIIMKEDQRAFDTYLHLRGGEILQRTTYPDSYRKKD